jgi:triacylglycerol lipase
MQFIQNACLTNFVVSSILTGAHHKPFHFDWNIIESHGLKFTSEYNYQDARTLLHLSLMVTSSNHKLSEPDQQLSIIDGGYIAKLADATEYKYSSSSTIDGRSIINPLNPPLWLKDTPLIYSECPVRLISDGFKGTSLNNPAIIGHVLYNEKENLVIIAFTGTSNACMAGLDLEYGQVEMKGILNYQEGLKCHGGIYTAYHSIRSQLTETIKMYLPKNPTMIITGHSLGGALSQLCALDMAYYNPIHYSFASPLIFNEVGYHVFTKLVKYSYRIANISDMVVLAPLPIMPNGDNFFHVGSLIHFQRNLGNYSLNHSLAYIQEFELPLKQ